MPYSKKDAEDFLIKVIAKLDTSAKKYNDNAYQVADIPKEIEEELVDLVGWPLLEVLRVREVMRGQLAKIEDIYWDSFFKRQTEEFLRGLRDRVEDELEKRRFVNSQDEEEARKLQKAEDCVKMLLNSVVHVHLNEEQEKKLINIVHNFINR